MKKLALMGALVLLLLTIAVPVSAKNADAPGQNKAYVCHVTGSETNPVVRIHVANGWDNGHGNGGPARHQNDDRKTTGDGQHAAVPFYVGPCDSQDPPT